MKKILVVDDEDDITEVMRFMLEKENFSVLTANSGKQALSMMEELTPDFIFLDISMPEMSGWDVLKEIRGRFGKIPVAMFTIFPLSDTIEREEIEEVVDYITKPFDKKDIVETLKQVPGLYEGG